MKEDGEEVCKKFRERSYIDMPTLAGDSRSQLARLALGGVGVPGGILVFLWKEVGEEV